jgi:cell division protein FtsB
MKAKAKFKRPSINGRLVVLLSAFIILILMLASPIRDLVAQRARIAALEIQVQQSEKQVQLLREIQAKWNDPNFIAAQARARLHYVMPGEIVFSVIGLDGKPRFIGDILADENSEYSSDSGSVKSSKNNKIEKKPTFKALSLIDYSYKFRVSLCFLVKNLGFSIKLIMS